MGTQEPKEEPQKCPGILHFPLSSGLAARMDCWEPCHRYTVAASAAGHRIRSRTRLNTVSNLLGQLRYYSCRTAAAAEVSFGTHSTSCGSKSPAPTDLLWMTGANNQSSSFPRKPGKESKKDKTQMKKGGTKETSVGAGEAWREKKVRCLASPLHGVTSTASLCLSLFPTCLNRHTFFLDFKNHILCFLKHNDTLLGWWERFKKQASKKQTDRRRLQQNNH